MILLQLCDITSIYNVPFTLSSAFNVIPCTSLLISSIILSSSGRPSGEPVHLCLHSDSGTILSGQSDKLPANNKKKRDEGHPASIYPFLPLSSLCNLIPLFMARPCASLVSRRLLFSMCTLPILWKHRITAASVCCIHSTLFYVVLLLCCSLWFNRRSDQTHRQTPLAYLWPLEKTSLVNLLNPIVNLCRNRYCNMNM